MVRFWRQWLLVASIITYAALCVAATLVSLPLVIVDFANAPPAPSRAGPAIRDVVDRSAASFSTTAAPLARQPMSAGSANSNSKWLAPEKDGLMSQPGALPFFPHRANTPDNHPLPTDVFESTEICSACHQDIYAQWQSSIMSRSWDDPIYRALLKRVSEATEGKLDNFCTGCHTPIGLTTGQITSDLNRSSIEKAATEHPLPGVDCESCHNYSTRTGQDNGAYVLTPMLNGKPTKFGPYKDAISPYHETVHSELHSRSDFCSVCHNVTHPFSTTAIERTYDEWHESQYAFNGQQCQSCHMPEVAGKAAIMGPDRPNVATHFFNGGNVTLLKHFGQPENAQRSRELLKRAGSIEFVDMPSFTAGSSAAVKVKVLNNGAGHKLPTGFPEGRQMWIDLTVTDARGAVVYRSGAIKDGKTEPGTQDYRVHLGDKDDNEVDTDIWLVNRVITDTRLLPNGYDIRNFVVSIPAKATGPFKLEAKLNYWPFSQWLADELLGPGTLPVEIVTMASADTKVAVAPAAVAVTQTSLGKPVRSAPPPASAVADPSEIFRDCADCPEMVLVPAGEFSMGSDETAYEKPEHKVVIASPFAIGRREVTFEEWDRCFAAGGCKHWPDDHGWGRGRRPVIDISWEDAQLFLSWLSQTTKRAYRLPTAFPGEFESKGFTKRCG